MCGIVGALSLRDSFRVAESDLVGMRDTMSHRGPDGAGVWVAADGRIGLAHRRLSIIDLSEAAAQPMANADGTLWLTYNGEIYNHAELRRELIALGRTRWRTDHSDTEVILQAFEQWGIECLKRFRGMFAFALWDTRTRQLWLVRDRIGVKPLYYTLRDDRVVFASEIKALLWHPQQPRRLNEEALLHYLSFFTTPAPATLFDGISKLPPATWLRIDADGRVAQQRYWSLWENQHRFAEPTEDGIAVELLEELRTAVELRKVSDVPVGVFLSGGIDSSLNATLFSDAGRAQQVSTFSIGYCGENASYPNELKYARLVADRLSARHSERLLSPADLLDFLPRMAWLQDEPLADPVCVPLYYVSKLARDNGVVVCQVGEGADELFFGYDHWHRALRDEQRLARVPAALRSLAAWGLGRTPVSTRAAYDRLLRSARGQPPFWFGAYGFSEGHARSVLSPKLRSRLAGASPWDAIAPIRAEFEQSAWDPAPANWMSYVDLRFRLPELLLMRVDKMSMAAGVEARVPFLDHRFVEMAMSIPPDIKFAIGSPKRILKHAVRGLLPDEILSRPKQGFGVPIHEWMQQALGEYTDAALKRFCRDSDLFDAREVDRLLAGRRPGHAWHLLNFVEWAKAYNLG